MQAFAQLRHHNLEVAALCDVDENILNQRVAEAEKLTGKKPQSFVDLRRLLEEKEIDVVSFATPNHWHALNTIWACQAGKDVYVEKPSSHGIWEGRKMVEAARKYGRVVQVGFQKPQQSGASGSHGENPSGPDRRGLHGPRTLLQVAKDHRQGQGGGPFLRGSTTTYGPGRRPVAPLRENRFHYEWHWQWGLRQR